MDTRASWESSSPKSCIAPLLRGGLQRLSHGRSMWADLYETYFDECNFDRPTVKEFMEKDWKMSGQNGESPQAWMERRDPDFPDSCCKKRQLAALWNRAEGLLAHKVYAPPVCPMSARSAPMPQGNMKRQRPKCPEPASGARPVPHDNVFPEPEPSVNRKPQNQSGNPTPRAHFSTRETGGVLSQLPPETKT